MKNNEKWDGELSKSHLLLLSCPVLGRMCWTRQKPVSDLISSASHFSLFFRRLTVALAYFCSVIKGITPENLHVVFCPNKQCCFEHFMCLDFVEMSLTVWDVAYAAVNTETLNLFIYMSCKCLWPHTMCTNLPRCNLHDDIARYFTLW